MKAGNFPGRQKVTGMNFARPLATFAAFALSAGVLAPAYAGVVPLRFGQAPWSAVATTAAAQYCTATGGQVQIRQPVYGTNDPQSQWVYLTGDASFCQYTAKKGGSHIFVFLTTLYSAKPSLAALAYLAKVKYKSGCSSGASPPSCYCTQLGGTDQFGGVNQNGGAWVLKNSPVVAVQTCIFPDLSAIDSLGLFYHAAGVIRGTDLSKVLRYHQ